MSQKLKRSEEETFFLDLHTPSGLIPDMKGTLSGFYFFSFFSSSKYRLVINTLSGYGTIKVRNLPHPEHGCSSLDVYF
jgi:hypothetical protein